MCLVYALLSASRTEKATQRKRKKNVGIFVRHQTTAMATRERYLFFLNKSSPSMPFPSRFFFVCICVCARPTLQPSPPLYDYLLHKQELFFAGYVSNRCTKACNENVRAFKKKEKRTMMR